MYVISLVDGRKAAIFAPHVAAVESLAGGCVVLMVDGTKYQSDMPMEDVVNSVIHILRNINR